jgi:aspartate dehydrogenase
VGRLLADAPVEFVAIGVSDTSLPREGIPAESRLIGDPAELADLAPHVVAEAAGRKSVGPWGRAALENGSDFVVSSMSAFADATLLDELRTSAERFGGQIQLQAGALAGIDALAAARQLGLDHVEHQIVKPPKAWAGTPADSMLDLAELSVPTTFFEASARETAEAFPKNANVAMTTALAGVGPDRTMIQLVADPRATSNRHEIRARGAFGEMQVAIANNPLPDNPKTSALAALGLARAIQNRVSPIVI